MPFIRNYFTLKRAHTSNFDAIIGLEKSAQPESPEQLKQDMETQAHQAKHILLIGLALGGASLAGFSMAAKKITKSVLPKSVEWLYKTFRLSGKGMYEIKDGPATFTFWAAPAYAGWMHASRSKDELQEQMIKTFNALFWFFGLPALMKPHFADQFRKLVPMDKNSTLPTYQDILKTPGWKRLRRKLLSLKTLQFSSMLLASVAMLSVSPQILNRYLTARKFEDQHAGTENKHNLPPPTAKTPLPHWMTAPIHPSKPNRSRYAPHPAMTWQQRSPFSAMPSQQPPWMRAPRPVFFAPPSVLPIQSPFLTPPSPAPRW